MDEEIGMKTFKVVLFPIERIDLKQRTMYVIGDRMSAGEGRLQVFDHSGKLVFSTPEIGVDYCICTDADPTTAPKPQVIPFVVDKNV